MMRILKAINCFAASVALVVSCLLTAPSEAALIVTEDFTYPDGSIAGRNGGENGLGSWTTAWAEAGTSTTGPVPPNPVSDLIAITSGQLHSKGVSASTKNVSRSFSSTVDPGTTLYFGMDLVQANIGESGYDTRLHLLGGTVKMGYLNKDIRVDLGAANNVFSPADDTVPRNLVARVEFDKIGLDEVLTFWINPTSELDAPQFTLQANIGATDLGSLVNIASSGQDGINIFFDNLAIGTDFNFTTPIPVPEPSSLMLLSGAFTLVASRRRRRLRG